MQHKTLEAKAVATELGEFTAIAAAYSVDRGRERIVPGAFANTIEQWRASEKQIPLHWDHEGSPESIIGTVDPAFVEETDQGLQVAGRLDLAGSAMAKEAWRLIKSGSMGLSFGYMVTEGADVEGGIYEIRGIDLFEVSITPSPMNADTKILAFKSASDARKEIAAMRKRLDEIEQALEPSQDVPPPPADEDEGARDEERKPTPEASDPEADAFEIARIEAAL